MVVGSALALQGSGRLPVAIMGDGDFLMGASALWTAAHYGIPLLLIVNNNRSYGNDVGHQKTMAERRGRPVANKWIGQSLENPRVDIPALAPVYRPSDSPNSGLSIYSPPDALAVPPWSSGVPHRYHKNGYC